jgi:hypothetical protein
MASNTASGSGDAPPVTAKVTDNVPGTPARAVQEALMEVAVTQEALDRMETKVRKAHGAAEDMIATAEAGQDQARAAADDALGAAMDLLGSSGAEDIRVMAAELAAEQARHAEAVARLAHVTDGEG